MCGGEGGLVKAHPSLLFVSDQPAGDVTCSHVKKPTPKFEYTLFVSRQFVTEKTASCPFAEFLFMKWRFRWTGYPNNRATNSSG